MDSNLLTVPETAKYLRLSVAAIRKRISDRSIPYVKLGRRVLFRRTDLDDLINNSLVLPLPSNPYNNSINLNNN